MSYENLELVLCTDNELRLFFENKGYTVLDVLENNNDNQFGILEILDKDIIIEEGATIGNLLRAIKPWEEIIGRLIDYDIKSYINAIAKPLDIPEKIHPVYFSHYISHSELYDTFSSDDPNTKVSPMDEILAKPEKRKTFNHVSTGKFLEMNNNWDASYMIGDTSYTFDYPEIMAFSPILINENSHLSVYMIGSKLEYSYIVDTSLLNFKLVDLITATFQGFFSYSYSGFDLMNEEIKELSNNIDNIVDTNSDDGDETISVEVAPGAFDNILRSEANKSMIASMIINNMTGYDVRIGYKAQK